MDFKLDKIQTNKYAYIQHFTNILLGKASNIKKKKSQDVLRKIL